MGLGGGVEHRGVELHKLHVGHRALGTIDHGDAVARGDDGVRGGLVHRTTATGAHQRHLAQVGVHLLCFGIEHVGTIAVDIWRAACHTCTQVVLRDDFHGEMVLLDDDVGAGPDGSHQSTLYLGACVIGMMEDAELGVATLTVQVELAVFVAVEVHAPAHQLLYLRGSVAHHLFNGGAVTDIVAGNHRVFDVFVEIVHFQVGHAGHTTLCERCVGLVERGLAYHAHLAFLGTCYFKGITHASHTGTDD